ncbi:hypothetical protein [Roseovarius sp. A-2]|uniref:hypothetical protein n=1 Tax=Roseovarius sp. A-2 TaxID=1570360 RepID=UPI00159372B3|nr:hypothetical protein [Roseovarius sp. A-2]
MLRSTVLLSLVVLVVAIMTGPGRADRFADWGPMFAPTGAPLSARATGQHHAIGP